MTETATKLNVGDWVIHMHPNCGPVQACMVTAIQLDRVYLNPGYGQDFRAHPEDCRPATKEEAKAFVKDFYKAGSRC